MTPVQSAPSAERPWLVGDIGGTNARFGLVREAGARPVHVGKVPSALHDGLASAARAYLAGLPERVRPRRPASRWPARCWATGSS
ncbi:glucokinase [Nocardiopsis composta]